MNLSLLDTELAVALEAFPEMDIWADLPLTRKIFAQVYGEMVTTLPVIQNVASADYQVPCTQGPDVAVRVYRPADQAKTLPALLWIHGGGYCLGSLREDDYRARQLVENLGAVVVSVDYRLAPEHPFPAPMDDCYAALHWLSENCDQLQVDKDRIAIGGLSAGAGLAAGLSLLARDRGEIKVIFQALLCPMIDNRCTSPSSYSVTDERVWNRGSNLKGWDAYLGTEQSDQVLPSIYAAPSRADKLEGLPATYIAVGTVDMFVDEDRDYADRLQKAGVPTQLEFFPGGFHAFEFIVPDAEISKAALKTHYTAIRAGLFPAG
jgi:acetyl esterase/lipase